jgi:2-alkyl-3-oxoalkanoate reductase
MRVFVAGAGGALGRRLVPQLAVRGHDVFASTTRAEKIPGLRALGAEALVMDGLDAASVGDAVARTMPDVIVHQMTALAGNDDSIPILRGTRRGHSQRSGASRCRC